MNKMIKTTCGLLIALIGYVDRGFAADDVDIRIDTGAVKSIAVGDNANASIQIGGLPASAQEKCAHINIQHGKLTRIAIGKNADATIEIPGNSGRCEEN